MQIFQKLKIFCCNFIAFLVATLNFKHLKKRKKMYFGNYFGIPGGVVT